MIHGSIHIWVIAQLGESPGASQGVSPSYLPAIYSQQSNSYFLTEILQ